MWCLCTSGMDVGRLRKTPGTTTNSRHERRNLHDVAASSARSCFITPQAATHTPSITTFHHTQQLTMSLLGVDYGSDSDDDDNNQSSAPPPPPLPPRAAPSSSSPSASSALLTQTTTDSKKPKKKAKKHKKKKAKVAISILPAHIQAALMRAAPLRRTKDGGKGGRFVDDDDDEDDDEDFEGVKEEEELNDEVLL